MGKDWLALDSGVRLEKVNVVIKCLGLISDMTADRFHSIKEMIGIFPNGDTKRSLVCDPHGMHAQNFTSFSTGAGSAAERYQEKWRFDFPQKVQRAIDQGMMNLLPKSKAKPDIDTPAYQYDVPYAMQVGMIIGSHMPEQGMAMGNVDDYFHEVVWACCPLKKYFEECKQSWDQYQEDWWKIGRQHAYVPYPYTMETVNGWFEEYHSKGIGPLSLDEKNNWMQTMMAQQAAAEEAQRASGADSGPAFDTEESLAFWRAIDDKGKSLFRNTTDRGGGGG
mmetsp:Transcript_49719/g.113181  ORF Transcript_49719/g.113181 Transcript_49719/m.113181 type:complete len:278 (+) Transcript_49719:2-835(+)